MESARCQDSIPGSLSGGLAEAPASLAIGVNPANASAHRNFDMGVGGLFSPLMIDAHASARLGALGALAEYESNGFTGGSAIGGALSLRLGDSFRVGASVQQDSFYDSTEADLGIAFGGGGWNFAVILRNIEEQVREFDIGFSRHWGAFSGALDLYKTAPLAGIDSWVDGTLGYTLGVFQLDFGILTEVHSDALSPRFHGGLGFRFESWEFNLVYSPYFAALDREIGAELTLHF